MTPAYCAIEEHQQDGQLRLSLIGELDLFTAAAVEDRLNELAREQRVVRIDLSKLEFIDSTGIRVLASAVQRARDYAWQLQIDPQLTVHVRRVLKIANLERYLLDGETIESRPAVN
jgi:anti-sigma B factor antagonist